MLVLAVLLGGIAVVLARGWLESQIQPIVVKEDKIPLTTTVVAKATLHFGNRIRSEHLEEVDWPARAVPPGSFREVDEVLEGDEQRVVLRRIERGEPILISKITGEGQRATLSAVITENMRAITIRVNDVVGVAGFVLPGDHVDILLTWQLDKGNPFTDILLQHVKVLGVDQLADDEENNPKVVKAVTVEVTSRQAQKLTLAAQVGQLTLALRNHTNVAAAKRQTITLGDLRVGEYNAVPQPKVVEKVVEKVVYKQTEAKADGHVSVTITRGLAARKYKVDMESPRRAPPSRPVSLLPRVIRPPFISVESGDEGARRSGESVGLDGADGAAAETAPGEAVP
jgi:pilus assembly protein CpaB